MNLREVQVDTDIISNLNLGWTSNPPIHYVTPLEEQDLSEKAWQGVQKKSKFSYYFWWMLLHHFALFFIKVSTTVERPLSSRSVARSSGLFPLLSTASVLAFSCSTSNRTNPDVLLLQHDEELSFPRGLWPQGRHRCSARSCRPRPCLTSEPRQPLEEELWPNYLLRSHRLLCQWGSQHVFECTLLLCERHLYLWLKWNLMRYNLECRINRKSNYARVYEEKGLMKVKMRKRGPPKV